MNSPHYTAQRLDDPRELTGPNYIGRMSSYFRCMYPLPTRILYASLLYSAVAILLCRVAGWPMSLLQWQSLVGVSDLFLLGLILRLMDELKDLEIDRRLFPERLVPSGRVCVADIRITLAVCCVAYLVLNLGSTSTFWLSAFCLAYAFLMFAHFFAPGAHRRHLLVALATHNPIVPLMLTLSAALVAASAGRSLTDVPPALACGVVLFFWFPVLGWELSRKIRCAEEETAYVTYSKIFRRVPASLIALAVQSISVVLGAYAALTLPLSNLFLCLLVSAYALVLFGHLRFVFRPSPATSRLARFAEAYALVLLVATVLEGAAWTLWR